MLFGCIGAGKNSSLQFQEEGPQSLPVMTGINLVGEEITLPRQLKGQRNILAFAFEQEQQEDVNSWIPVGEELENAYPDVRFYEVPVIYEMGAVSRMWVNNGMRSGIPSDQARERTITVYTDRDKFLNHMEMNKESIYVVVANPQGEVLWREKGPATDKKVQALKNYLN